MSNIESDNRVRISAVFYGHVQGVGFRYSAHHLAEMLRLTGWVRNEYDGSVIVEIQGGRASIDQWFSLISQRRFIEVERVEKRKSPWMKMKEASGSDIDIQIIIRQVDEVFY